MERATKLSFRLTAAMRERLVRTARLAGKSRDRIVREALAEHLDRAGRQALTAEARRQSLLASSVVTQEEVFWENDVSSAGWR